MRNMRLPAVLGSMLLSSNVLAAIVGGFIVLNSQQVTASPVTYGFSGSITNVTDPNGYLAGTGIVAGGSTFAGSFTYDPINSTFRASYNPVVHAGWNITQAQVSIGKYSNTATDSFISIENNSPLHLGSPRDTLTLGGLGSTATFPASGGTAQSSPSSWSLSFNDNSATAFTSTSLPSQLSLSSFNSATFSLGAYYDPNRGAEGMQVSLYGDVTKLYSLTSPPSGAPTAYGIFLGDSDATADGATDAKKLQSVMVQSGILANSNTVLLMNNQITTSAIESAISNFKLVDGDKLYLFFSGHGGNVGGSGESTATPSDEFLALSNDPYLISDDQLSQILRKYNGVDKWVMLDSCFAGGFWGNNKEDGGDLEQLNHIALLAAASETEYARSSPIDGSGIFTMGLMRAFERLGDGYLRADNDKSGILTFVELDTYMNDIDWMIPWFHTYAYLKGGVGDLVWLDETSFPHPFVVSSADFTGSITNDQATIPEPPMLALFGLGLAALGFSRRKR